MTTKIYKTIRGFHNASGQWLEIFSKETFDEDYQEAVNDMESMLAVLNELSETHFDFHDGRFGPENSRILRTIRTADFSIFDVSVKRVEV